MKKRAPPTPEFLMAPISGRRLPALRAMVLVLGALLFFAGPGHAQTIQGRVLDAGNRRPVDGAIVRLLDFRSDTVAVTAADSLGRFRLEFPDGGRFRLLGTRLGYRASESPVFDAPLQADTIVVDLRMEPAPLPVPGVEVTTEQTNRRLRQFLGMSPGQLRIRPIQSRTIDDHVVRGHDLSEMMSWLQVPNLQVLRTREGPCYQLRGRGCLPVYLDGTPMTPRSVPSLPLEMLNSIVILLPSESTAYPAGAVHLFTRGFMR
ncbi:MAG: carboxypeptidase-like regulatory domain-containing protein [Longimicrobiales bacterium]|nr:carboxypeptidase-like regulatory domain-containing protein [Longimicrobiales bacterium]